MQHAVALVVVEGVFLLRELKLDVGLRETYDSSAMPTTTASPLTRCRPIVGIWL